LFDVGVFFSDAKHSIHLPQRRYEMVTKICCIVSLLLVMALSGASLVTAQSASKDQLVKFYESCITKKISNCNAKTVLKTSRSANLRHKADLATRQVTYFKSNKSMLINEMVEQGIGQKHYKVEHYLNKRFFETHP
jgi:hypothetical protein